MSNRGRGGSVQRVVVPQPPLTRLTPPPARSAFVFGPRGTGKSTAARQWFPGARTVDLRDTELGSALRASPRRLHTLLDDEPVDRWIVIDEIQRVPALLDVVHQRLDNEPSRRFLMTGSSPRQLYRAGANLLGGRADVMTMPSFLAAELGSAFTLDRAMRIGMLPVVCTADDPEVALRSYVRVAVYEELRFEANIRRLDDFARALEQFALCQGALWSPTTIAAAAQARKSTVTEWFRMLEEMYLIARLDVFTRRPSRRSLALTPKVYFADCGVARALRPTVAAVDAPDAVGATREGLVYQHLAAWCAAHPRAGLWTWRTSRGVEVDFVIETPDDLIGIDVKSTRDLRPADRRGLLAFHDEFPDARLIALTDSALPAQHGPIREQPLEDWLRRLVPGAPLP